MSEYAPERANTPPIADQHPGSAPQRKKRRPTSTTAGDLDASTGNGP